MGALVTNCAIRKETRSRFEASATGDRTGRLSLGVAGFHADVAVSVAELASAARSIRMSASVSDAAAATTAAPPDIVPGVIVGGGRVGSALFKLGGGKDVLVKRGESIPGDSTGPILICTRNDALDGIVDMTPPERREDLVFLQNGMLDPWLASRGLENATQVLVYFAVAKLGDLPVDGVTDLNPEGLTAASGKWAEAVAARLHAAGLSCKVLSREAFEKPMLEKLIWISAFMLVGAKNGNCTVGDVESKHRAEVEQLILELANAACQHQRKLPGREGFAFEDGLVERLCAYARSVAHFPTAIKEMQWRNGWFLGMSEAAQRDGSPDPCPLHTSWLKAAGAIP